MPHREEADAACHGDQQVALNAMRRAAASRMKQSISEIPHAWLVMEADVSNLIALQMKLAESFLEAEGVPLSIEPFVMKGIVYALKEYPVLNSSWISRRIAIHKPIHLSVPIGTGDSQMTLVVRHADRTSIAGLAIQLHDMHERTKRGMLTLAETQGGTFTFLHTGEYGSHLSKPIIAYPQAAVLTFERIVNKPVVIDDMIAIRSMVRLCLSFDHRILDGRISGLFLKRVKYYLEKYDEDTVIY